MDSGVRAGLPTEVAEKLKALERENRELRQANAANEILRKASAYFAQAELDRRFKPMIAFIDDHREAHGVEPICKVLPIAPSTYHGHVAKRRDPFRRSARAKRDEVLKIEVRRVFEENFRVYGVRKVWRQLRREGFDIACCTISRLMREMGLEGPIRGKPIRTTVSDKAAPCRSIRSIASSMPRHRTGSGSRILPMSRPGSASFTWPSLSTPMPAGSSAGGQTGPRCWLRSRCPVTGSP